MKESTDISIHKALTGLDLGELYKLDEVNQISIHKALTGLDWSGYPKIRGAYDFNPQGPHGPRPKVSHRATGR